MLTFALQFAQILPHPTPFRDAEGMLTGTFESVQAQPPSVGKGAYVDHHSCVRANSLFPTHRSRNAGGMLHYNLSCASLARVNAYSLVLAR